jgi:hypothetical protein
MQFKMIRDGVDRMKGLIKGTIYYSRTGKSLPSDGPGIHLNSLVDNRALDFEVDPSKIRLSSKVHEIAYGSFNFRRVLENLIE